MGIEKKALNQVLGKLVVTKEGRRLGFVKDTTFETKTGELLQILIKDSTAYAKGLNLEVSQERDQIIPYNSIIAIGDFVVVSEEDLV